MKQYSCGIKELDNITNHKIIVGHGTYRGSMINSKLDATGMIEVIRSPLGVGMSHGWVPNVSCRMVPPNDMNP